jgi:NAD+ synthase (glutamine-hydrolysing)
MGMTYEELGLYGRLRKITRCGPVAMFRQACQVWREVHTPQQVADKVRPRGCVCAAAGAQAEQGRGGV